MESSLSFTFRKFSLALGIAFAVSVFCILFITRPASAQTTYYFVGTNFGTGTDWSTNDEASCTNTSGNSTVPSAGDTIILDADCDNSLRYAIDLVDDGINVTAEAGYAGTFSAVDTGGGGDITFGTVNFAATAGTWDMGGFDHGITGDMTINSTAVLTTGANTVTFSGTGSQSVDPGGTGANHDFNNIVVSNTADYVDFTSALEVDGNFTINSNAQVGWIGGNVTVTGTFTNNGTVQVTPGNTYTVTNDTDSGLIITTDNDGGTNSGLPFGDNYYSLTIDEDGNSNSVVFNLDAALDVNGDLTITDTVTLDLSGFNLDLTGTLSNTSRLQLQGGETVSIGIMDTDSGDVIYDGTGTYSNLAAGDNYNNLIFSGTGSWTLDAALDVNGDFNISSTGTVDVDNTNNYQVTVGGNWSNSGTFTARSGTVVFDGSSVQTFDPGGSGPGNQFYNVTVSGDDVQMSTNGLITNGPSLTVSGLLDLGALPLGAGPSTLSNTGTIILEGSQSVTLGAMDTDSGLIEYDGTGTYTELAFGDNYYSLDFNAAGSWTLDAALDVNGNLRIIAGTLATGGNNINLAGNWTNNSTFTHGSAEVLLDGSNQQLTGDTTFNDLSKGSSPGETLTLTAGDTFTIATDLTLTGTAGGQLSLQSSSSGSAANISVAGTGTTQYLNVKDINNTGATLDCTTVCNNQGGNTGWTFPASSSQGIGSGSSSPTPKQVTVTYPNNEEVLAAGETIEVTWTYTGSIDFVNLGYSLDNGETWTEIAKNQPNTKSYDWVIPSTLSSDTVLIRVQGSDLATSFGTDQSDGYFSVVNTQAETEERQVTGDTSTSSTSFRKADGTDVELGEGGLFRGESLSEVYMIMNGKRMVFPNEATYMSHFSSFESVVMVEDGELANLQLGGRVTMKAGSLVKIQTNPYVYEVQSDGTIRHVPDEATAKARYGDAWNTLITDVPATFWGDYTVGNALESVL